MANTIYRGAIFDPLKKHRFCLWRRWDLEKPMVMFVGLNPSLADESKDDPTIRMVCRFAEDWGFGGMYMMNLFSSITPYPDQIVIEELEQFEKNKKYLLMKLKAVTRIVFCWGSFDVASSRGDLLKELFKDRLIHCLGLNTDKSSKHPLYLSKHTRLKIYHKPKKLIA